MNSLKFTIGLLVVVGLLLQLFSFTVSYAPVHSFLSSYVGVGSLLIFFTVLILGIIELSVFSFLEMCLRPYSEYPALRYVFVALALIFGIVSATLTTIGAGQVATDALVLQPLQQVPETAGKLEGQIAADNNRLGELYRIKARRENGWMREEERKEMLLLQERIDRNTSEILRMEAETVQKNSQIEADNDRAMSAQNTLHSNFAFVTQIFLAVTMALRHYLQRIARQQAEEPDTEPSGNHKVRRIQVRPQLQQQVVDLKSQGFSHNQVAEQLGVNKSTVSRILNGHATA